ncbi:hypothetical protein J6590_105877 [Homalodisca vitripennis]|nr:hypothetical protein J6590_105877 [Homalodisca vitripennis]
MVVNKVGDKLEEEGTGGDSRHVIGLRYDGIYIIKGSLLFKFPQKILVLEVGVIDRE